MFGAIGGILSGIAGIGGLFKKDKPQKVENEVDYVKMVKNAEAAGFNPLTAIRNGGSAGFTTTTTHPALSGSGFMQQASDAVGGLFNAFSTIDPNGSATEQRDYDMVRAQLGGSDPWRGLRSTGHSLGGVPSYEGAQQFSTVDVAGTGTRNGRPQKPQSATDAMIYGSPLQAGDRNITNPFPVGSGIMVDPTLPDASVIEDFLGESEIVSAGYAAWKAFKTFQYNYEHNPDFTKDPARVQFDKDAKRLRDLPTELQQKMGVKPNFSFGELRKRQSNPDPYSSISDPRKRPSFQVGTW